jgi:hypothetical protein
MRILCACLLAFTCTAFADDWTDTVNRALRATRQLVATDQGAPKAIVDESLCIIVLPWATPRNVLMDSTGAFRIVSTTASGAASCRTGAAWNAAWSRTWLLNMEVIAPDSKQWGEKTDILLFIRNRRAAERLRSGSFALDGLTIQAGATSKSDRPTRADVVVFARTWRPTAWGRGGIAGGHVTEREVSGFAGLDLDPSSRDRGSSDNAKLHGTKTAEEILTEPLPESDRLIITSWKTDDEFHGAYRKKVMGETYRSELQKQVTALIKKDDLTRWAIALGDILDRASPTAERQVTFVLPEGKVTSATTTVRGRLSGFRELRGVRLADLSATVTPAEGGMEFAVANVALQPGENILRGVVEEASGVEVPIQVTVTRTAGTNSRKSVKTR